MELFFLIFISAIIYLIYQFKRNDEVYNIRTKWAETNDEIWHQYTYDYMINPSQHNLFGLKWPKEIDYPSKQREK